MKQLHEYCSGKRTTFSFTIEPHGTAFQHKVWAALRRIPYGATRTYGQVAQEIGQLRAVRAVASAIARNPVVIVIPCHRVVPATGGIGRYDYGARRKKRLLEHESRHHTA